MIFSDFKLKGDIELFIRLMVLNVYEDSIIDDKIQYHIFPKNLSASRIIYSVTKCFIHLFIFGVYIAHCAIPCVLHKKLNDRKGFCSIPS